MNEVPPAPGTDARQIAMFIHLSQLAGLLVPILGLALPVVLWQVKRAEMPEIDAHGRMVVNWIISLLIYIVIAVVLIFVLIGIPILLALMVMAVVFPVIGGIKANNGEFWHYPLTITFIR